MSDKPFWNANKEKKQIFFLYHFLNLGKNEFERQIDEQLQSDSSNRRRDQAEIARHRTSRYPQLELSLDVMQKGVEEATKKIGDLIYHQELDYLIIPYRDDTYNICLKDYFNTHDNDVDDQAKKILLEIYASHAVPIEAYEWIDTKDDRQVNYIWSRLRISFEDKNNKTYLNYSHNLQSEDDIQTETSSTETPLYETLGLQKNTPTNELKLQNIIYFFDLWSAPLNQKKEALKIISDNWETVRKKRKMVDLINENEPYVLHIWDYVIKNFSNNEQPIWSYISSIDKKKDLEQTKLALQTYYDLLKLTANSKTLLDNIQTNVRHKRYHDKHSDTTKLLNTRVSIEAVNALNKLAKTQGKSKKAILENLIIDALSRMD